MKLVVEDLTLPCERYSDATLTLEVGDRLLLNLGPNQVEVKVVNGNWTIYCNDSIKVEAST
jgi:hypothetical protein